MSEEEAILKITGNLKNAVSAILQGYGDGQGPVTDTSAELHRLCGCLELLLQFDQKEQRSFLGARKDYWDFLITALRQHRGYTEQTSFVCSQNKHGRLPPFLEKKKGDSKSLTCPQSIWEREGGEIPLDLKGGDTKNSKSLENSAAGSQQQREGAKGAQKEATGMEDDGKGSLPVTKGQGITEGTQGKAADWDHDQGMLAPSLPERVEDTALGNRQEWDQRSVLGQPWVLQDLGIKKDSTTEKPQEWTAVTSVTRQEDQAEVPMPEVVKDPRYELQLAKEQAQCQEQLLRTQGEELQALQEQLSRCQAERAHLQVILEQKQREAERRNAMYEKELEGQRDLVQAMKRRVLELIHEKDHQWQRLQHLSTVAPGHCVDCNKAFRRLSRRYPCRLCGGLVCHACSADYKKREHCCPACAQREEIQIT
ncbi:RUN and FYVE domain-containing protein 4 [Cricetulus griseus]|uniref:RUN and FYVE domain-containing protein 4 n=1 Tax=Cricetulus griseus TaxID=10029 RepID=G3IM72_CRIGR|nr:RUN and FYVE domain-containing protein 4 [Cricetulus griseus]